MKRLLMTTLAVLALAGCGGVPAASPKAAASQPVSTQKLRLAAGIATPTSLFVWLALDAGIFARNGLTVEVNNMSGQAQMQSLVAGDSEAVLHVGADLVFTTEAQGSDLQILFTGSKVDDDYFVTGNDVTSFDQLKGKKLGAQSVTSGNGQTARRLMAKFGLQEGRDYTTVITGSTGSTPALLAALVAHQIDAAALPPGLVREPLRLGQIRLLLDIATRTDLPIGSQVLVLQSKYIEQHPDVAQKLVDSLIEAVRLIYQDKAAAQNELRSRFRMTEQSDLDEEWQRQTQVLAKLPTPVRDDFVDVLAAMPKDVKPLSEQQVTSMLNARFVDDASRRGLTSF